MKIQKASKGYNHYSQEIEFAAENKSFFALRQIGIILLFAMPYFTLVGFWFETPDYQPYILFLGGIFTALLLTFKLCNLDPSKDSVIRQLRYESTDFVGSFNECNRDKEIAKTKLFKY